MKLLALLIPIWLIIPFHQINAPQGNFKPLVASVEPTIQARITCYLATGNLTASGKVPKAGMIATSDRTIPFGTEIIIDGETYIVEDRTNKRFQDFEVQTIDIFWEDSLESCLSYGVQYKDIIIK
jgi:3D (Asp-Asp-Asp) domain-containing protein